MGVSSSLGNSHHHGGLRFAPEVKFKPMVNGLKKPPGHLVAAFKAKPPIPGKHFTIQEGDAMSWIVDCQFLPYNDNSVATSVGAYYLRPGRTSIPVSRFVNGLICSWNFGPRMKCQIIKGSTTTAPVPKVHIHPNGQMMCYIGAGNITFMDIETLQRSFKTKDSQFSSFKYFAWSPNGNYVAYLCRKGINFEVKIMRKDGVYFLPISEIRCDFICPSFLGTRTYTENVECKWSPDSAFVAVSSSMGHLLILRREGLDLECNIIPGMFDTNSVRLSTELSYDFDPRYCHSVLTFCDYNSVLCMCNIKKKDVICQEPVDTQGRVTCIQYDTDGRLLAVATTEGIMEIRCPDTLELTYNIDMSHRGAVFSMLDPCDNSQAVESRLPKGGSGGPMQQSNGCYPYVTRISFSQFADLVAVSSSDGFVRVWQLSPDLSLLHQCRRVILQNVKASDVRRLPLPPQILCYLLQWPREIRNKGILHRDSSSDQTFTEFKMFVS